MKLWNVIALVVGFQIIFLGAIGNVWAGSAGGAVSCLVNNPGSGALALRGTIAVDITSAQGALAPAEQNVDFIVRLERSGVTKFFRLHLQTPALTGLTNEEIACRIFNPNDTPDADTIAAVTAFVQQILNAFGLTNKTQIVITDSSVSNADQVSGGAAIIFQDGTNNEVNHEGSLADITAYAR